METAEVEVLSPETEGKKEKKSQMAQVATRFLDTAKNFIIKSREQLETADEFCARALKNKQEAEAFFKPQKKFFDDKKKIILEEEKKVVGPLDQGRLILKTKMQEFKKELAREEAKKAAEAAEKHRKEQEAARKAEEDKRIAQAQELEAQGKNEEAEKLLDAPLQVNTTAPLPAVSKPMPKMKTTIPEAWDFEVIDESLIPREYLMIDEKKLRAQCKVTKKDTNIPGIRAYDKNA